MSDENYERNYESNMKVMLPLYKAMHAARAEMGDVAKSGHNKYDNYDYSTLKDYLDVIQEPCNNHKLLLFWDKPSVEWNEVGGKTPNRAEVSMVLWVCHVDSGAQLSFGPFKAEAFDRSDKAAGKAFTMARKEALRVAFNLYSDDDADEHSPEKGKMRPKPPAKAAPPQEAKQEPKKPQTFEEKVRSHMAACEDAAAINAMLDKWSSSDKFKAAKGQAVKALNFVAKAVDLRCERGELLEAEADSLQDYIRALLAPFQTEEQADLAFGGEDVGGSVERSGGDDNRPDGDDQPQ